MTCLFTFLANWPIMEEGSAAVEDSNYWIEFARREIALNELAIAENELLLAQIEEARAIAEIRRRQNECDMMMASVLAACTN